MARKSNVNPDHYKVAGREPQGQDVLHEVERQKLNQKQARLNQMVTPPPAKAKSSGSSNAEEPGAQPPQTKSSARRKPKTGIA